MIEQEKRLLLIDLCARWPYGVKVLCSNSYIGEISHIYLTMGLVYLKNVDKTFSIDEIKPYLRPMSSMSKEEDKEFQEIKLSYHFDEDGYILFDWLNEHHFDYRGLIPLGLGIDCTGLNIYENEKSI